jgi:hypothetical protein
MNVTGLRTLSVVLALVGASANTGYGQQEKSHVRASGSNNLKFKAAQVSAHVVIDDKSAPLCTDDSVLSTAQVSDQDFANAVHVSDVATETDDAEFRQRLAAISEDEINALLECRGCELCARRSEKPARAQSDNTLIGAQVTSWQRAGNENNRASIRMAASANVSPAPPSVPTRGTIEYIDRDVAHAHFRNKGIVRPGTRVDVHHQFLTGWAPIGQMQVVTSTQGSADLRPVGTFRLAKVARGDRIVAAAETP